MGMPRRLARYVSERIGYIVFVIGVIWALFLYHHDAVEKTAQDREIEHVNCVHQNELRGVILGLVNQGKPAPVPPGADPALRAAIENANANANIVRANAAAVLAPVNCDKLTTQGHQ